MSLDSSENVRLWSKALQGPGHVRLRRQLPVRRTDRARKIFCFSSSRTTAAQHAQLFQNSHDQQISDSCQLLNRWLTRGAVVPERALGVLPTRYLTADNLNLAERFAVAEWTLTTVVAANGISPHMATTRNASPTWPVNPTLTDLIVNPDHNVNWQPTHLAHLAGKPVKRL